MNFKEWLETSGYYQPALPFAQEEDPPDLSKINRYKSRDDYVKAQSRYTTKTGGAAESIVKAPMNYPDKEEVVQIVPNALMVPAYQFSDGRTRPERGIAFVHLQTKEPQRSSDPAYQKKKYRILAYWQGSKNTFSSEDIDTASLLGGLMGMGGYILDVWVDPEYRGDPGKNIPNLYKALMTFSKKLGIHGLMPYNATCPNCGTAITVQNDRKKCPKCGAYAKPLASRDFKVAQAKYDWNRAKGATH